MRILRRSTKENTVSGEKATQAEIAFLAAKVEQIKRKLDEEISNPNLIMAKGIQAQISIQ